MGPHRGYLVLQSETFFPISKRLRLNKNSFLSHTPTVRIMTSVAVSFNFLFPSLRDSKSPRILNVKSPANAEASMNDDIFCKTRVFCLPKMLMVPARQNSVSFRIAFMTLSHSSKAQRFPCHNVPTCISVNYTLGFETSRPLHCN